MSTDRKRNGKIDLLRFIFAVIVVIFHGETLMVDQKAVIMFSGRIAGEFFFLVSGYFMAASAEKLLKRNEPLHIGRETEHFLFRKYCSLYPAVIVGDSLFLIVTCIGSRYSLLRSVKTFVSSLPCFFLFHYTGIHVSRINETWFLSVMLISMAVLFPLLLRHHGIMRRIGSLLLGSMILGYLMITTQNLTDPDAFLGNLVYKGTLRGFGDICLGIFAYEMAQELRKVKLTHAGRLVVTVSEYVMYGILFWYILFCHTGKYDYFVIYLVLAALIASFSDVSYGNHIYNNKVSYFLGKSSLYIYLSHSAAKKAINYTIDPAAGNAERMGKYLLLATVFTVLVWIVSNLCSKLYAAAKKALVAN